MQLNGFYLSLNTTQCQKKKKKNMQQPVTGNKFPFICSVTASIDLY